MKPAYPSSSGGFTITHNTPLGEDHRHPAVWLVPNDLPTARSPTWLSITPCSRPRWRVEPRAVLFLLQCVRVPFLARSGGLLRRRNSVANGAKRTSAGIT